MPQPRALDFRKAGCLAILCVGLRLLLPAQAPDSLHLQRSLTAEATFVTGDNLSNIYLISPENAVVKIDSTGRQAAIFTNNRLGQAIFVDASNPLKILVWYPDFQTVVLLDRTMTELGRLNFSNTGLYSVRCVAMASDGNIWAFDDAVSKAIKLGLDGVVLLESPPLNVYFPTRFSPTRIRDSGRYIWLNDPSSGLCALDQYANLENIYNTFRISDFESDGDWLFYLDQASLCLQNQSRLILMHVPLPFPLQKEGEAWLGKNCIFFQKGPLVLKYAWY